MNLYTNLKDLCLCPSVSGRENKIREKLSGMIAPFADEVTIDALGNLIAKKHGKKAGAKIMLCAHMDEIGFLVTFIEDSGMLRVANVGGIRAAASAIYRFSVVTVELISSEREENSLLERTLTVTSRSPLVILPRVSLIF